MAMFSSGSHFVVKKLTALLGIDELAADDAASEKTKLIIRFFYFHLVFLSFLMLLWSASYAGRQNFDPVWPMFWARFVDAATAVNITRYFFVGSTLFGAWFYHRWIGRFAAFLGILEFHAMTNSFGIENHQWLPWLYAAFLFLFLPCIMGNAQESREERRELLMIFWGAQAAFFATYFLSGFGKVYWSFYAAAQGGLSAFVPDALARHIAAELSRIHSVGAFGSFFVEHPLLGWPLTLGVIYFQFFALWAAFRPSLHRLWAFALVCFHLGTYLIMNIVFFEPVVLLLVFFADSPFRRPKHTWRVTLRDLPLFGWVLRWVLPAALAAVRRRNAS